MTVYIRFGGEPVYGDQQIAAVLGFRGKSAWVGMAEEDDDKYRRYDEQRRNEPPRQLPREETRTQDPIDVTPRREEPVTPPPPRDDEPR